MTIQELLKALADGKKIRRKFWFADVYLILEDGKFVYSNRVISNLSLNDLTKFNDWEIHVPSIKFQDAPIGKCFTPKSGHWADCSFFKVDHKHYNAVKATGQAGGVKFDDTDEVVLWEDF